MLPHHGPPGHALSWHLNGEYEYDPDPAKASEIEVRFVSEGPSTTRVELEHRYFERHGGTGARLHDSVGGDGGWGGILAEYAAATDRSD